MTYLFKSHTTHIKGREISIRDLLVNGFNINIKELRFWFQYTFRRESIEYAFYKDFICATALVVVFQYINFQYLELFRERVWKDEVTGEVDMTIIEDNLATYNGFNFIGTI
jgi:hypothetical protein